MAKIGAISTIGPRITIELNESEAAALDAIVGYGADSFIKAFYKELGRSYLEPHEAGLRSLFEAVRSGDASVSQFLDRAKQARYVFANGKMKD